jgi:hypothetical protein
MVFTMELPLDKVIIKGNMVYFKEKDRTMD